MELPCKKNFTDSSRNPRISFRDHLADRPPRAFYLHVPFCQSKCAYCDFYSDFSAPETIERYLGSVEIELGRLGGDLPEPLDTIYFGGGTPTLLSADALARLCGLFGTYLAPGGEFSVEANPATLDVAKIDAMAAAGVTRVTLGAQSFDPLELTLLGRIHNPQDVATGVALLRRGGIENIGLDLIYAIPDQSLARWEKSLHAAVALDVEHVSCYALSFESSTPFGRRLATGDLAEADEELQRGMYDLAVETLGAAGLEQYEISNFAKAGRKSRHNLVYWHNRPYAAIGPAAAGYLQGRRWTNRPDLAAWLTAIEAGHAPPCDEETLSGPLAMAETVMLGLRLMEGISLAEFAERYDCDLAEVFPKSLARHLQQGSLLEEDGRLRLQREAFFISDSIFADFIDEARP